MDLRALSAAAFLALAVACNSKPMHFASRGRGSSGPPPLAPTDRVFAGGIVPSTGRLSNPLSENAKTAAEGATLFATMNCEGCHGVGAVGDVGPNLGARRWRYGGTDADIFQSIYYGRPHGMPAFGGALTGDVIWKLVTYIKSLPPPTDMPTESWVTPAPGN
jgi:cytochrome c oxidase cbb3-type subunit III